MRDVEAMPLVKAKKGNESQTNFFFSYFPGYPGKTPGYPAKKYCLPGFEGRTGLFGPHPFVWKTPTPTQDIRTEKFGFGFLFLP